MTEAAAQRILVLHNTIQEYDWGSRTVMAELFGWPSPAEKPQAELWMGAHPKAPSTVRVGGRTLPLGELIRRDPEGILGREAARRFAAELPFLFKVLAAGQPLSIQAHPDARQARAGFRREEEAGVPRDAFQRNYRDPHHKPEVLSALTPFWALEGFRPLPAMIGLLRGAGLPALGEEISRLEAEPNPAGLRRFFAAAMTLEKGRREQVVAQAVAWAKTGAEAGMEVGAGSGDPDCEDLLAGSGEQTGEAPPGGGEAWRVAGLGEVRRWIVELDRHYPGDVGVLAPLFLNLLCLQPGDTVFLQAGVLHAYLDGAGVELMANSDNVLRGGLTRKHVDVAELLRVVHFESLEVHLAPRETLPGGESAFRTPAQEFRLSEIRLLPGRPYARGGGRSVEILICLEGGGTIRSRGGSGAVVLSPGTAVLVPAALPGYTLVGEARLYKAAVPPA